MISTITDLYTKSLPNNKLMSAVSKKTIDSVNILTPKFAEILEKLHTHKAVHDLFMNLSEIKTTYYQILIIRNNAEYYNNKCNHTLDMEINEIINEYMTPDKSFESADDFINAVNNAFRFVKALLYKEIYDNIPIISSSDFFADDVEDYKVVRNDFEISVKQNLNNIDELTDEIYMKNIISSIPESDDFSKACMALYIFGLLDNYIIEYACADYDNPDCIDRFFKYITAIEYNGHFTQPDDKIIYNEKHLKSTYALSIYDFTGFIEYLYNDILVADLDAIHELTSFIDCGTVYELKYSYDSENNAITTDCTELYTF